MRTSTIILIIGYNAIMKNRYKKITSILYKVLMCSTIVLFGVLFGVLVACKSSNDTQSAAGSLGSPLGVSTTLAAPVAPTPLNLTEIYVTEDMDMLDMKNPVWNYPKRKWYFSVYLDGIPNTKVYSGLYPSHGELLAAHIIEGEDVSKGSFIYIHGFAESVFNPYSLTFGLELISKGYRLIMLNLPGHEFSGGNRLAIKKFSHYGDMIKDFFAYTDGQLGESIVVMGHSVGGTAIYEAMVQYPEVREKIDASVLLTPLYRVNKSDVLAVGVQFIQNPVLVELNFMDFLNLNTNDEAVLNNKYQYIPGGWINTQREWEESTKEYPVIDTPTMLVFGTNDTVIDYEASLQFYSSKVKNAYTKVYRGQGHLLLQDFENPELEQFSSDYIISDIANWLEDTLEIE